MAHTYAFAIGGAIVLALTLTPVARVEVHPGADTEEKDSCRDARARTASTARSSTRRSRSPKRGARRSALIPVVARASSLFPLLGGEFMPKLEEGNFWIRATLPMSISLEQSAKYVGRMRDDPPRLPDETEAVHRAEPQRTPRCVTVVSQLGRPDDGTDVAGFYNIELFAPLKPFDEWPRGADEGEAHRRALEGARRGVPGRRLQLLADDLRQRRRGAVAASRARTRSRSSAPTSQANEENADADRRRDGDGRRASRTSGMFRSLGQPSIKIMPDRAACARYGLNTGDVEAVIQAAIGGQAVTQVYEGEKRFDLTVRWLSRTASSIEAIREITVVDARRQRTIPLGQIAHDHATRTARRHLPRGRPALRAGEVLGPRARPRVARSPRRSAKIADEGARSRTTRTSSGPARSTS